MNLGKLIFVLLKEYMKNNIINVAKKVSYLIVLKAEGELCFTVDGDSNYPFICSGDKILIIKINKEDYRIGQHVLFWDKQDNSLVVHRIVSIKEDYFITKGDNNWFADSPVYANDLHGLVKKKMEERKDLFSVRTSFVCKLVAKYSYAVGNILAFFKAKLKRNFKEPSVQYFWSKLYRIPINLCYYICKMVNIIH